MLIRVVYLHRFTYTIKNVFHFHRVSEIHRNSISISNKKILESSLWALSLVKAWYVLTINMSTSTRQYAHKLRKTFICNVGFIVFITCFS